MARKSRKNIQTDTFERAGQNEQTTEVLEEHSENVPAAQPVTAQKKNAMKAAVYARLSVEDDITMDSLDTQIKLIRDFIDCRDDIVYEETYFDNGYSGTNFNRPAFNRMMQDLRKGKIQCIVVKDLSRFGRNYLEADYYIETILPFLGARLLAVTDNFDSLRPEDMNSLLIPVKNLVNTMYSKDLSKKIWTTAQRKKKAGVVLGNGCVYGYILNQETGRFDIDPATAPTVQMIFQWRLMGLSTNRIADNLNLMGAPTPRQRQKELGILKKDAGKKWESSSVSAILMNECYIGNTVTNKTSAKIFAGQEKRRTEKEEWIITENTHAPIIARDDFEKIREKQEREAAVRMERRSAAAKINEKYPDQLKGLLYCGECGRRMCIDRYPHGAESSVKTVVYCCRHRKGQAECQGHTITENLLKMLIMRKISEAVLAFCNEEELWKKTNNLNGSGSPINKIKSEIQKTNARLGSIAEKRTLLYENLSAGIIDKEEFRLLQDTYKKQHEEEEEALKTLEEKLKKTEEISKEYFQSAEKMKQFAGMTAFDEDKVRELVERVDIFPDKHVHITFRFKKPFAEEGDHDDSGL